MARTAIVSLLDFVVLNVVELGEPVESPTLTEYATAPEGFKFVTSETAQIGDILP